MNQSVQKPVVTPMERPVQEEIIDLRALFQTLLRFKWSIISFTLAAVLLTVMVVFSLTPQYQATAVLLIEQEEAKVVSIEEMYGIDGSGDSYLNTQHEVLKSRALLEKVARKLNLVSKPEFNAELREQNWLSVLKDWRSLIGLELPAEAPDESLIFARTVDVFAKNVRIEPVRKTQIVRIHVMSEDPKLAAAAANAMGEAYIDSWLEAKLSLTTNATSWMQERLEGLAEKLRIAENQLHQFRVQEDLVDMEGVLTLSNNELKAMTESLVKVRQKLALTENIYRQIQNSKARNVDEYESLPAVLAHPLVQSLKETQAQTEQKVRELGRRYGPKHPKMISANTELDSINGNIRIQIQKIVSGVEKEFEVAKANEQSLLKAMGIAKKNVQDINSKQFRLRALEREVRTNKDLYDAFFKRIQETSATSDLQSANARIVDHAYAPELPVKPKKSMIVGIAGLVSFLLACGMAYLLESLNSTLRTARDIEESLNLPVMGLLPVVPGKSISGRVSRLFLDKEQRAFIEAVRTIRTSLSLSTINNDKKIIAVTSTVPGEGKSSVSANIALAMGQLSNTLLIDGDLRRPTVGKNFNIKGGTAGLANLLTGNAQVSECIQSRDGIKIMPAGMIPPDPTQLFYEGRFKKLLEGLSEKFDTIIIDCPPMTGISDTLMISQICDSLMYVVEAGRTNKTAISHATGRLLQNGVPLTGVVLNKVDTRRSGDEGYYGYYDSYGYSDVPEQSAAESKTKKEKQAEPA